MIFKFPYILYPPFNPEARYRPMLRVSILINNEVKQPDWDALVDSGSDKTISYAEFGKSMGVNFEDKALRQEVDRLGWNFDWHIEGIGKGQIPVCITPADIQINGKLIKKVQMHWIKHSFTDGSDFPVMLGQDTVFQAFDIHFSKRQRIFFLNDEVFTPKD